MTRLDHLAALFARLPGLGKKSATRIAHYLLKADRDYVNALSSLMREVREKIHPCAICGNYTEQERCDVCTDPRRDGSVLCVVEDPQDVQTVEATQEYHGLYHVLMGALSPIDGIGPRDLRLQPLLERVKGKAVREVIIATNPTVEGETTALYVRKLLADTGVAVTRLAFGLPMGGDLEYADRLTLARALKGRTAL